jgi:hypothetical protein
MKALSMVETAESGMVSSVTEPPDFDDGEVRCLTPMPSGPRRFMPVILGTPREEEEEGGGGEEEGGRRVRGEDGDEEGRKDA